MAITLPTNALKSYIAQSIANKQAMQFDRIIFAYINGLNDSNLANVQTMPTAAQIKHSAAIQQAGYMNENEVVYSVTLGSEVGDFTFNFVGLVNSQNNLLAVAVHTGEIDKVKTKESEQGNALTRNIILQFNNAKSLTNIRDMAKSWQFDFTNYFLRITPKTLSATTTNSADANGHTHALEKASTTQAGIVKLNDSLTSDSASEALTAKQGKALNEKISSANGKATPKTLSATTTNSADGTGHTHALEKASTTLAGIVKLNDSLTSDSASEALTAKQGKALNEKISSANGKATPKTLSATTTNSADGTGHTHALEKASTTQAGIVKLSDSLTSDSASEALTAKQGKALNEKISSANGKATPKTLGATSTNSADATGHSHALDKASTTQAGIVKLSDSLTSDSASEALTAKQGKALNEKIKKVEESMGSGGFKNLSVQSVSQEEGRAFYDKYNGAAGGFGVYPSRIFNCLLKTTLPKNKEYLTLFQRNNTYLASSNKGKIVLSTIMRGKSSLSSIENNVEFYQDGQTLYLLFREYAFDDGGTDGSSDDGYQMKDNPNKSVSRLAIFDI